MNFKDKKILITGATGGIGNCLVEKFYSLGAKITATGTNEEKLQNLKKKFPQINTDRFKLDNHADIEKFIDKVQKNLNGLDILVNNAGITMDNLSIRLTEENWKKVLDINLTSSFLMCKFAIKKKEKISDVSNLEKITNILFSNKRKMINKNIKKILSKEKIKKIQNLDINLRPSEIKPDIFYKITELYEDE